MQQLFPSEFSRKEVSTWTAFSWSMWSSHFDVKDVHMKGDEARGWVDVDLRQATPGWRAAFVTEQGADVRSLVGWLVQRRGRERRLVAAGVDDDGRVVPVEEEPSYWRVLAPNDADPSWDEAMTEHGRRIALMESSMREAARRRGEGTT